VYKTYCKCKLHLFLDFFLELVLSKNRQLIILIIWTALTELAIFVRKYKSTIPVCVSNALIMH